MNDSPFYLLHEVNLHLGLSNNDKLKSVSSKMLNLSAINVTPVTKNYCLNVIVH